MITLAHFIVLGAVLFCIAVAGHLHQPQERDRAADVASS